MTNEESIFELLSENIEELISDRLTLDEAIEYQDLLDRKLFLTDDITIYTVNDIIHHILSYNSDDRDIPVESRKPIKLYISTSGGEVIAGMALVDTIVNSKTPIHTINLGSWYSMGLYIGMAGHKRYAYPNSTVLLHDGSNVAYGTAAKVQDQVAFMHRVDKRLKDFIVNRSKITAKEFDKKAREEWYMFAEEAKEKGIIDLIIGIDCGIDEVV